MSTDSIVSGPMVRQSFMAEGHGGRELLTSWWPGSRETEEGIRNKICPSKANPQ
jgi:hypothetical protein